MSDSADPYAPPAAEAEPGGDAAVGPGLDPHLLVARATLAVAGVQGLLWGSTMPVIGAFGAATDPDLRNLPNPEVVLREIAE